MPSVLVTGASRGIGLATTQHLSRHGWQVYAAARSEESLQNLITAPGTGAYSASKYAVESLTDAPRMELWPWHIPVSLIEPLPIRTDMWGDILLEHDRMVVALTEQHRDLYAAHLNGTRKLLLGRTHDDGQLGLEDEITWSG